MLRDSLLEQEVVYEQFDTTPVEVLPPQAILDPGGAITGLTSNTLVVGGKVGTLQNVEAPQPLGTGANPTFNNLTVASLAASGLVDAGDLRVGGAETIKIIDVGTVSIDPGSIAAQTRGSVTFTLTGAAVGDIVIMQPPGALNSGLVYAGCEVTSANTVTVYLGNLTGVAIDDGSNQWRFMWFDTT